MPAKELNIPPYFFHPAEADKWEGKGNSYFYGHPIYKEGEVKTFDDGSKVQLVNDFFKRIK